MTREPERAYIGIGSNLDNPLRQVSDAFGELGALPGTRVLLASPCYQSPPLGPEGQPDYVNAVAMLDTEMDALALLDGLQLIEQRHGRVRGERWGPRTLDLDLLLFGDRVIESPRLSVPHPEMPNRAFVLVPLHDIAPGLILPGLGQLSELLKRHSNHGLTRIGPP